MIILAIETSCDETALALVQANGSVEQPEFKTIATSLFSQVKMHEEFGGVVPMLAKREHQKNLVPLFEKLLTEANIFKKTDTPISENMLAELRVILSREEELLERFLASVVHIEKPAIDAIAVTEGPGLEPALWVGISFARALSLLWNIPVIPTNHMEGHICSVLTENKKAEFPILALLISGGHTELVLAEAWKKYTVLGQTRDDAVGEAFDKVARILGLPYPGGPEISKLAEQERKQALGHSMSKLEMPTLWKLPRPMLHSNNFDFSCAGLKTAVLYMVQKIGQENLTEKIKAEIAREFEDAITEVLITKTKTALEKFLPQTLIIGGGVIANKHIRESFQKMIEQDFPETKLLIPEISLATDNAVMIGMAGYITFLADKKSAEVNQPIKAQGNLSFYQHFKY